jgi:carboxymethylenebutenolidase
MNASVELSTAAGTSRAEIVRPVGNTPAPTVIVVHEWWGVNDDIRRIASRLADAGLAALIIDLYGGRSTTDMAEAMQLSNQMKTAEAMDVVRAAVAHSRGDQAFTDRVSITGFCLGGAIALAAACTVDGLASAVPFYGTPREEFLRFSAETPPILGHYGEKDTIIDPDRIRAISERATAAGAPFEVCFYDAGHAFLREGDPAAFHAPSAQLAWERTIAFLRRTLA